MSADSTEMSALPESGPLTSVRAARRIAYLGLPLCLAACQPAILDPQGPIGRAERSILGDSMLIMLAIVIPTILATLCFSWWYRAGNPRAKRLPDFSYSGSIELVTWSIPVMTVMLLGGVAWIGSHDLDPARPIESKAAALEIQVVSLDWKWLFIYPDQRVASVNELVIPVGTPVQFTLTSASVMNAFFVPQLGSMIYVMNGMASQLHLQADTPGAFEGLSTHFSGDGFSDMRFRVRSMEPSAFDAWVDRVRRDGPALDKASYATLAKQSIKVVPFTYRTAESGLFQNIVAQVAPPGPGPVGGRDGSSPRTAQQAVEK